MAIEAGAGAGGAASILENPAFLQMLFGAGQDISTNSMGQGRGTPGLSGAFNSAITDKKQTTASQNFMKLLGKFLGPDGTGGTLSNKGLNMTIPTSELASMFGGEGYFSNSKDPAINPSLSMLNQGQAQAAPVENLNPSGGSSLLNPFVDNQSNMDLNLSGADLTGLSPQDIVAAFGIKQRQDELRDNQYIERKKMEGVDSLDRDFPISVPGMGTVSLRQWNSIPDTEKLFILAKVQAEELGDKDFTREEWEDTKPSDKVKFLETLLKRPELMKAEERLRRAGATVFNSGEFEQRKTLESDLENEKYFSSGEFTKGIDKKVKEFDKNFYMLKDEDKERAPKLRKETALETVEGDLASRGFTIKRKYWTDATKSTVAIEAISKRGKKQTIKVKLGQ